MKMRRTKADWAFIATTGVVLGLLLGGWFSGTAYAQPFSAQIQRALRAFAAAPVFTGQVKVGDGTAAAPSYTFASDPDNGMYLGAANDLRFSTSGAAQVRIVPNFFVLRDNTSLTWSATSDVGGSGDLFLLRDAAGTLAQRNGTNAQALRIYRDFTSAGNVSYLELSTSGSTGTLAIANVGSPGTSLTNLNLTSGNISLSTGATVRWNVNASGHFVANLDNAYDIGASGATRPRDLFLGRDAYVGATRFFRWAAGSVIGSASDGVIRLANSTDARSTTFDSSGTPTCPTNCGTSPTITGTNSSFTVTMGASGVPASGFVATFSGTWAAAPQCHVTMALAGMVVGKMPLTVATTTTTATVVTNGTAPATSDKYHFQCSLGQ